MIKESLKSKQIYSHSLPLYLDSKNSTIFETAFLEKGTVFIIFHYKLAIVPFLNILKLVKGVPQVSGNS